MIWGKLKRIVAMVVNASNARDCSTEGCLWRDAQFVQITLVNKERGIIYGEGYRGKSCERCRSAAFLHSDGTRGDLSDEAWAHEYIAENRIDQGERLLIFHHFLDEEGSK